MDAEARINSKIVEINRELAGGGESSAETMMAITQLFTETAKTLKNHDKAWQRVVRALLAYAKCAEGQ